MPETVPTTLMELSVELIHQILDKMDYFTILCSARNVCTQLNIITDSYLRYQVSFTFQMRSDFYRHSDILVL